MLPRSDHQRLWLNKMRMRSDRHLFFTVDQVGSNSVIAAPSNADTVGSNNTPSDTRLKTIDWPFSNETDYRPNSLRAFHFVALQRALQSMCTLPEDHEFHVDPAAARNAANLLGLVSENFNISPPRVLPQDGEAVVFTWDFGRLKRYLTVDEHEVDLMDLDKEMQSRQIHDIASDSGNSYTKLINILGIQPISTTTIGNDVQW